MRHRISRRELLQVQLALLVAIGLQLVTRFTGNELLPGSQYLIILTELGLALMIGFTVNSVRSRNWGLHHALVILLLAMVSIANVSGLIFVLNSLINSHGALIHGQDLLASAIAIFITNIIVFALWYWEIDSPGLTRKRWSKNDKDFQFTQQNMPEEFPDWQPEFIDYLYLSVSNAITPAEYRPITRQAKMLMATQSLVSVFTIALLIARAVNILGS